MREHAAHCEKRIALALAGELADADRAVLEEHLDACATCRTRLRELAHVDYQLYQWGALTGSTPPQPQEMQTRFEGRLLAAGALRPRGNSRSSRPLMRAVGVAAVVMMAFCLCLRNWSRPRVNVPSGIQTAHAAMMPPPHTTSILSTNERGEKVARVSLRRHARNHVTVSAAMVAQEASSPGSLHFFYRGVGYDARIGRTAEAFAAAPSTPDFSRMRWEPQAHPVFPYRTDLTASSFHPKQVSFNLSNFYLLPNGMTDLTRAR